MDKPVAWLSVIGINENGVENLSAEAHALIAGAALVMGGKRHLALAGNLIKGEAREWPSPIQDAIPLLLAHRPQPICVLASGDPFCYGIGATLAQHIPMAEMRVLPALSIFTLATTSLGWAFQDIITIGLNGRPLERIIPLLQPGARILALSADETTPTQLAQLLTARGFGQAHMQVLEHLGGKRERIRSIPAYAFAFTDIARLNCIALELPDNPTPALPRTPGLPDTLFSHDGQLTKREIRAVTLSALAPRRGELLWDIGLGAGSIAIEWLLADPANRAIGIEHDPARAARAAENARTLGVPQLQIVQGAAPQALAELLPPDAIFLGGGARACLDAAWNALKPGGRIVANAVTLETEQSLVSAMQIHGGALTRLSVERAEAVGKLTGWKPAMTVTQWSATK